MDAYLPDIFSEAMEKTLEILEESKKNKLKYISVLFHDNQYCEDYQNMKKWYEWLICYVENSDEYIFSSYVEAINEPSME